MFWLPSYLRPIPAWALYVHTINLFDEKKKFAQGGNSIAVFRIRIRLDLHSICNLDLDIDDIFIQKLQNLVVFL